LSAARTLPTHTGATLAFYRAPVVTADGYQVGRVAEVCGPFMRVARVGDDFWIALEYVLPGTGGQAVTSFDLEDLDRYRLDQLPVPPERDALGVLDKWSN
jgi:hypothetical protein